MTVYMGLVCLPISDVLYHHHSRHFTVWILVTMWLLQCDLCSYCPCLYEMVWKEQLSGINIIKNICVLEHVLSFCFEGCAFGAKFQYFF